MKLRPVLLAAGLVLILMAGIVAWSLIRTQPDAAPDFTLTSTGYEHGNLTEPVTFNLTDYEGKTLLIDFMAVNCSACRIVTKELVRPMHEKYGDRSDFSILSIDVWAGSSGETNEELIKLQKQETAPWRHALDTDSVLEKYGAFNIPMLVVIDGEGKITYSKAGIPARSGLDGAIQASLDGVAGGEDIITVGLVGLAFVAGAASIFSPCCIGLLPSYMGYLASNGQQLHHDPVRGTLKAGAITSLGISVLYVVLALVLWLYGPFLRPHIDKLGPIIGVAMVFLGLAMLLGWSWSWISKRLPAARLDGRRGFFAFGVGYGFASFGCTGPVFLPLLLAGFLASAWLGFTVLASYVAALALLVFLAAYLTATGQSAFMASLAKHSTAIQRVSAVLMIGAGGYLLAFYWRAYGGFFG